MNGTRELHACKRRVKILILLLFWLVSVDTPYSHGGGVWTNEPSGAKVLIDCPFNSVSACGILDVYNSAQLGVDSTAPVSPNNSAKAVLYAGEGQGGMQLIYTTPNPVREMFVGFTWRTNPQFQGRIVNNKLWFIRGQVLGNGYFGMFAPPGSRTMVLGWGHNTTGLDNSHVCAMDLGLWCYPNAGPSVITMGQWAKIEVYQKASTTATSRDGALRWWVNGVLAGSYSGLNYSPGGLNEWQWNNTWDGAQDMGKSNTVNWEHWIDHLHVSIPNGGASADSPAGPPSAPTLRGVLVP